jgi:mono/diheme cytochrome c family protein
MLGDWSRYFSAILLAIACSVPAMAEDEVDFLREIRPILATRCAKCHSDTFKQEGGLKLDSPAGLSKGGDSGPLFVAGQSGTSRLIERVITTGEERMPPEGDRLTDKQIALLRRWIDQGAKLPAADAQVKHWALEPPQSSALPVASPTHRLRGPIDVWLDERRKSDKTTVIEPASRSVLARRLYLDLIGLPPTEDQLAEFTADEAPDAYERLVDRLLASPAYGERWGRHWMDVWRYSDWDGYGAEIRESQPHVWRWRDWIIESLNADRPYNQMIVEMLAGDELAPDDPQTLRATGFLVRNWFKFNRNVWLDNTVEHTGKAFLGLTLNCARCHDHMYDSIRQPEYYSMRAIFEPYDIRTDRLPGQSDTNKDGLVRAFDAKLETPTFLFTRGDEKQPEKEKPVTPGIPQWLALGKPFTIQPVALSPAAYYPNSRSYVHEEALKAAQDELAKSESAVAAAQQALADAKKQWNAALAAQTASPMPATPAANTTAKTTPATPPSPATPAPIEPAKVIWSDDFKAARPELWKTGAGEFQYIDGKLLQKQAIAGMAGIVSQSPHPRDFSLKFRFKITGGQTYKSIGVSFDAVGDQEFNFVYASAYSQGPKLQAAHRRAGVDAYPPEAAKTLPVVEGREYELTVIARDTLVNVLLDGQLQLAHRFPSRPSDGRISLWCYDATGEYLRAELSTLPTNVPLVDVPGASNAPATAAVVSNLSAEETLEWKAKQAEFAAQLAEKNVAASKALLASVSARIAADRATYSTPPAANAKSLAIAAVKAEREHAVLAAESKTLDARVKAIAAKLAAKPGDDKSQKALAAAEKAVVDAEKAIEPARQNVAKESDQYTRFGSLYPTSSSGRRLALARWIAADDNPLTPRVAINHMWLRHFGSPLVSTVFEFGANGQPPTHPALLDWLARQLVASGWSMKAVHREMLTSDAFRLSSTPRGADQNKANDPENVSFWRMNSRRMEAELVRDATLAVSGNLIRQFSGADLDPAQGLTLGRRSVYFRTSKEKKMTFLALFDSANVSECYRRSESVAPQQALAMVNSSLTLSQSRLLAAELTRLGAESDEMFVEAAYRRVLGRMASEKERQQCLEFLSRQTDRFRKPQDLKAFSGAGESPVKPASDPRQRARENLVHVLLNHNDFLTIR